MPREIRGGAAAEVICDAIHSAEITYRDKDGNVLLTHQLGTVKTGGRIEVWVPKPDDITITVGG